MNIIINSKIALALGKKSYFKKGWYETIVVQLCLNKREVGEELILMYRWSEVCIPYKYFQIFLVNPCGFKNGSTLLKTIKVYCKSCIK